MTNEIKEISCDSLVIGSGPGGSYSAYLLAKAKKNVILIDEGENLTKESAPSYSIDEMTQKYRNGGLTASFGNPKIVYIEPRCVGGASEINAGLCHDPLPSVLEQWQNHYEVENLSMEALMPHLAAVNSSISIKKDPSTKSKLSKIIATASAKLNWKSEELPRFWDYSKDKNGNIASNRQSMTRTFIPQAKTFGCKVLANTKVNKIVKAKHTAKYAIAMTSNSQGISSWIKINFQDVFICCGAIQTPLLLRRSGIRRKIGNSLRMHPYIRVVSKFSEAINQPEMGVSPIQVNEFKPRLTLGGSYGSLPHLALWLNTTPGLLESRIKDWKHHIITYALCTSESRGYVRNLWFFKEPFVYYSLSKKDALNLGEGLFRLGQLLFEGGALELAPPISGMGFVNKLAKLEQFKKNGLPLKKTSLSTIHLFGSCPMGENRKLCAINSYGKLFNYENIYINDASMLPDSPGVNPQKTILAITRRNILKFLDKKN